MNETFPERLVELQKDPDYFTLQKLEQLKVVFDRASHKLGLTDSFNDLRQRDKLAIIILVRSKAYPNDDELYAAAINAMRLHMEKGPRE